MILLMEEILHHLLSMKPYEKWDSLHINWCRILFHRQYCITIVVLMA